MQDQERVEHRKAHWQERRNAYFALVEAHATFVNVWYKTRLKLTKSEAAPELLDALTDANGSVVHCRARIPLVGPDTLIAPAEALSRAVDRVALDTRQWHLIVEAGGDPPQELLAGIEQYVMTAKEAGTAFRMTAQKVLFPA
ncbi:hypothetical protein [Streptomyces sp. NBC_00620]|uniref:hypothetical protein n=1 Tax=Streptomyces sp. NBC_00620 TaxID=2903666 RepID=UPI00225ADA1F|nr:hypothetical protein [Streptomyces sp. NBC_00620]MCX4971401.1 hypothetical protein [Streptomyces sp. NBC_00620]